MLQIFLDIETIPDQRVGALQKLIDAEKANFKAPSNLTKTDAIEALKKHGYAFDNDPKFIAAPEIKAIYERELAEVMAEPQARPSRQIRTQSVCDAYSTNARLSICSFGNVWRVRDGIKE